MKQPKTYILYGCNECIHHTIFKQIQEIDQDKDIIETRHCTECRVEKMKYKPEILVENLKQAFTIDDILGIKL